MKKKKRTQICTMGMFVVSLRSCFCGRSGEGFDKRWRTGEVSRSRVEMYIGLISLHSASIEIYNLQKVDHPALGLTTPWLYCIFNISPLPFHGNRLETHEHALQVVCIASYSFNLPGTTNWLWSTVVGFIDWISYPFPGAEWKICCNLCLCERTRFSCNWGIVIFFLVTNVSMIVYAFSVAFHAWKVCM